jgi:hypothetical protein
MKLWIGNIEPGTTDDELRAFVRKYTAREITSLEHVPGDGSRPGVMLQLEGAGTVELNQAQLRLHGMHWKSRALVVQVMLDL